MCEAAFPSNSVLKNNNPLFEIGEECGTSATSPSRRAPSSVSSTCFKTSSSFEAFASTIRPHSKGYELSSLNVLWFQSGLVQCVWAWSCQAGGVVDSFCVG